MSNVNIPLLRKAVEWAEAEAAQAQGHWYQGSWVFDIDRYLSNFEQTELADNIQQLENMGLASCGTAYCIAGYVAQEIDERFKKTSSVRLDNGDRLGADEVATRALGLTRNAADCLFASTNSINEIRSIAETIAGEKL